MLKKRLLKPMDQAVLHFDEDFSVRVSPNENQIREYLKILDLHYKTANGWKINLLSHQEIKNQYNVAVFEYRDKVVGGISFNRNPEPQEQIYSFFQDKSLLPPIELIENHKNIVYPTFLILSDRARQRNFWNYVSELFLKLIRAMGGDFAMMAPALRPRRLDLLYKRWGFTRISPRLFADHYKRFEGDTEPNCVLMMRGVNPGCELDPALVAYGKGNRSHNLSATAPLKRP